MVHEHKETPAVTPEVTARNRRLAIILALIAVAFYVGFILLNL